MGAIGWSLNYLLAVVKLFNAVQKQQKYDKSGPKEEISKSKLIDMLKSETASSAVFFHPPPKYSCISVNKSLVWKKQGPNRHISCRSSTATRDAPQWSVLKDDYLTGQAQNYKDWDKNESSEEEIGDLASYGSDDDE